MFRAIVYPILALSTPVCVTMFHCLGCGLIHPLGDIGSETVDTFIDLVEKRRQAHIGLLGSIARSGRSCRHWTLDLWLAIIEELRLVHLGSVAILILRLRDSAFL